MYIHLLRQVNSKWSTACRSWSYAAAVAQDLRTFWPRQVYKDFAIDCVSTVWQTLFAFFVVQALWQFRHALRKRDPVSDVELCKKNFYQGDHWNFRKKFHLCFCITVDRNYYGTLKILLANENRFYSWNQISDYYWIFQMRIKLDYQQYQ